MVEAGMLGGEAGSSQPVVKAAVNDGSIGRLKFPSSPHKLHPVSAASAGEFQKSGWRRDIECGGFANKRTQKSPG
ncbi:hypothetical protein NDU88_006034 [Pleurodeles waltl]|uniref:Uncharacterized protein n=1 Tax=Pleurodeles waltl TaxID=8319 RepID=A0AAV7WD41_PLEWA|nr:hypothetical protein NDU88_006034 [Pleurodeles waltl]